MVHYRFDGKLNNMKYDSKKTQYDSVHTPPPSRWDFCALKFKEFCKRTDLHGFKYITMEELSVTERYALLVRTIVLFSMSIPYLSVFSF